MAHDRADETAFAWPRYPRVLVALDDSPAAAFALRHAVPYAIEQRLHLTLVTVVPRPSGAVLAGGVTPQQLLAQMEAEATARLRRLVDALPQGLSVTTRLRHGDPAAEILALLHEQPFDLLCIGRPRPRRVANVLLGSVSAAVLHHSPVPVTVFHPPRAA
jgi:nucleotide-binding universal stress UspA family protein